MTVTDIVAIVRDRFDDQTESYVLDDAIQAAIDAHWMVLYGQVQDRVQGARGELARFEAQEARYNPFKRVAGV